MHYRMADAERLGVSRGERSHGMMYHLVGHVQIVRYSGCDESEMQCLLHVMYRKLVRSEQTSPPPVCVILRPAYAAAGTKVDRVGAWVGAWVWVWVRVGVGIGIL